MSYGVQGVSTSPYLTAATASTSPSNTLQAPPDPFADPNGPFANLNLTAQQQQQIQQIFSQNSNSGTQTPTQLFSQVESVLTPQQQQTLQSDLETLKSHHHHDDGSANSSNPSRNSISRVHNRARSAKSFSRLKPMEPHRATSSAKSTTCSPLPSNNSSSRCSRRIRQRDRRR